MPTSRVLAYANRLTSAVQPRSLCLPDRRLLSLQDLPPDLTAPSPLRLQSPHLLFPSQILTEKVWVSQSNGTPLSREARERYIFSFTNKSVNIDSARLCATLY